MYEGEDIGHKKPQLKIFCSLLHGDVKWPHGHMINKTLVQTNSRTITVCKHPPPCIRPIKVPNFPYHSQNPRNMHDRTEFPKKNQDKFPKRQTE